MLGGTSTPRATPSAPPGCARLRPVRTPERRASLEPAIAVDHRDHGPHSAAHTPRAEHPHAKPLARRAYGASSRVASARCCRRAAAQGRHRCYDQIAPLWITVALKPRISRSALAVARLALDRAAAVLDHPDLVAEPERVEHGGLDAVIGRHAQHVELAGRRARRATPPCRVERRRPSCRRSRCSCRPADPCSLGNTA